MTEKVHDVLRDRYLRLAAETNTSASSMQLLKSLRKTGTLDLRSAPSQHERALLMERSICISRARMTSFAPRSIQSSTASIIRWKKSSGHGLIRENSWNTSLAFIWRATP